jgi:hypothetical protein
MHARSSNRDSDTAFEIYFSVMHVSLLHVTNTARWLNFISPLSREELSAIVPLVRHSGGDGDLHAVRAVAADEEALAGRTTTRSLPEARGVPPPTGTVHALHAASSTSTMSCAVGSYLNTAYQSRNQNPTAPAQIDLSCHKAILFDQPLPQYIAGLDGLALRPAGDAKAPGHVVADDPRLAAAADDRRRRADDAEQQS